MTTEPRSVRIQLMIALMCGVLLIYLALLGRTAVLMISFGRAVAVALDAALLVLRRDAVSSGPRLRLRLGSWSRPRSHEAPRRTARPPMSAAIMK